MGTPARALYTGIEFNAVCYEELCNDICLEQAARKVPIVSNQKAAAVRDQCIEADQIQAPNADVITLFNDDKGGNVIVHAHFNAVLPKWVYGCPGSIKLYADPNWLYSWFNALFNHICE